MKHEIEGYDIKRLLIPDSPSILYSKEKWSGKKSKLHKYRPNQDFVTDNYGQFLLAVSPLDFFLI